MYARGYRWFAAVSAVLLLTAMMSCKGRTAENVLPAGDTVEVNIDSTEIIITDASDSASASTQTPADSVPEAHDNASKPENQH